MKKISTSDQIIQTLKEELPYLKDHFSVSSLHLFGSYVKNKQTENSDVDLMVTFTEVPGFIKFIGLENYLSEKLGLDVDLVMKDALKPHIGQRIHKEAVLV